jgi:hypothetical protein
METPDPVTYYCIVFCFQSLLPTQYLHLDDFLRTSCKGPSKFVEEESHAFLSNFPSADL